MKSIIIAAVALAIAIPLCVFAQRSNRSENKRVEGATIRDNKATLKAGYEFVRVSENKVSIRRMRTNDIGGSFTCLCGKGDGSCSASVSGSVLICLPESCEGSCTISVVVGTGSHKRP